MGVRSVCLYGTFDTIGCCHVFEVPKITLCGSPTCDLPYVYPSAPLPPPLLTTTIGCSVNLYFVIMLCTVRAMLSVPPPGPAVAMNSSGFVGCQATAGAANKTAAMRVRDPLRT